MTNNLLLTDSLRKFKGSSKNSMSTGDGSPKAFSVHPRRVHKFLSKPIHWRKIKRNEAEQNLDIKVLGDKFSLLRKPTKCESVVEW